MHFQLMGPFPFLSLFLLKLIYSKKANKCYRKSPAFFKVGDFFKFLWPSQNICTLNDSSIKSYVKTEYFFL